MAHPDMDQLLQAHERFWVPASGGRALLAECPHPDWQPKPYPLAGGIHASDPRQITSQDMDVRRLLAIEQGLPALTNGDRVNCVRPAHPVSWLEAVLGCSIHVSAFSCTSEPVANKCDSQFPAPDAGTWRHSPWLRVMDQVLEAEVTAAGSACPAEQLHLRGVIDMLAAYLGEERLCISVYDAPKDLLQLADRFADLYIEIAMKGLQVRPPWRGGYVSSWGVYAPGPLLDYQIDASSLFSLETYEKHFASFDEKVLSEFEYTVIHLHSCGLHIVPAVVEMRGVHAVQISLDKESSAWEKERVLEACHRIQSREKSLIICGEVDEHELDELLCGLKPGGLAIFYWKPRPR